MNSQNEPGIEKVICPIIDDDDEMKNNNLKFIRNPFEDRPDSVKLNMARQTKRTQRYRSVANSRVLGMTVGDIRYCFQQLRNAGDDLSPHMILYNGQCAGEFALAYLQETSNATRKRRKRKSSDDEEEYDIDIGSPQNLPETQLKYQESRNTTNILEF